MSFKATFSTNANWEHALERAVEPGTRKLAHRCQMAIDGLRPIYAERPLEEVKQALQQAWANVTDGAQIKDPLLREYANAIRAGRPVKVKYMGLKK